MRKFISFILITMPLLASAQVVVSSKTDDKFGGHWLDMEATQQNLKISLDSAAGIQKVLRDCLETKSQSYFRARQAAYLAPCLSLAQKAPLQIISQTPGLTVVFDMDETLITQWHKISAEHPEKTTFQVRNLDVIVTESKGELMFAPKGVTVRPGIYELLNQLTANSRIGRIYFFSAREDKSAAEIRDYILAKVPMLKRKFGGLLARSSLRLDIAAVPSKDLRIFSRDLKRIVLVDDNPGRVLQKALNFTIPKFNADAYLEAIATSDKDVIEANKAVTPFVGKMLNAIAMGADFKPYSTEVAQAQSIDWGKRIMELAGIPSGTIERLLALKIFDQTFFGGATVKP